MDECEIRMRDQRASPLTPRAAIEGARTHSVWRLLPSGWLKSLIVNSCAVRTKTTFPNKLVKKLAKPSPGVYKLTHLLSTKLHTIPAAFVMSAQRR
jgi:hypothetical protein